MSFKKIDIKNFEINPVTAFADKWMLLTAGNEEAFNTMTVSWGHLGALWGMKKGWGLPTAVVYVRPQRYTKQFMDKEGYFTLSMFDESHRSDLAYLGMYSGKDVDKVKATGISPVFSENGVYFEEANTVFVCRKLYQASIVEEGFVDKTLLQENYPNKDYHEVYIGEIVDILVKE